MGWFSDDSDESRAYNDVNNSPHKAELSHELIASAASFEAAKAYEDHVAVNGQPQSHALAKELVAGFAGGYVDRIVETKGLDFYDKEKAKHEAKKRAEQALVDSGGYGSNNDSYGSSRYSSNNDSYGSSNNRYDSNDVSYGSNDVSYGSRDDRDGSRNDSYGSNNDSYGSNNDSYGSSNNRYGSNNDSYGSGGYN